MRFLVCAAFALAVLPACRQAPVGVRSAAIPQTSAQTCASQCQQVGLTLDSLVIMAGRIGCVCRAAPSTTPPDAGGPAAALASIILSDEEEEEANAASRRRNSSSSTTNKR